MVGFVRLEWVAIADHVSYAVRTIKIFLESSPSLAVVVPLWGRPAQTEGSSGLRDDSMLGARCRQLQAALKN